MPASNARSSARSVPRAQGVAGAQGVPDATSDATAAVPAAPPSGTKARRTYEALLDATERCLDQGGYAAATTTEIARQAGVSVGTFYSYLPDRDTALVAAFARRLDELIRQVDATLTADALLDDGLPILVERAVDVTLAAYRDHAAVFRTALAVLPSSPAVREVYWNRHERSEQIVVTFLRRARRAGMVADGDPVTLARTMLVVIQGLNHPLLLAHPRARAARAIRAEVVRMLTHLLEGSEASE